MTKAYDDIPTVLLAEPIDAPINSRTESLTLPNHQQVSIEEKQISRLVEQGYSRGLAESLNRTKAAFGQRIWIIDNSGSMRSSDGHRIVPTLKTGDVRMVPCSRWEEIQECVNYHISLAGTIEASTYFRVSCLQM